LAVKPSRLLPFVIRVDEADDIFRCPGC